MPRRSWHASTCSRTATSLSWNERLSFEKLLSAAEAHLHRGDLVEAESACQRALAQRPNDGPALLMAAGIAARQGKYDRSEYLLGRLLKRDPAAVGALYLLARVHWHANRPRKALTFLLRGLHTEFGLPAAQNPIEFWGQVVDGVDYAAPPQAWYPRLPELFAFGAALERCGELASHQRLVHDRLSRVDPLRLPRAETVSRLRALLGLAGFSKESAADWNRGLAERIVLPWLKRSLHAGLFDAGLMLERTVLDEYVTQTETEAHFAATVGQWAAEMRVAGRAFGEALPALPPARPALRPKVAFFVHRLSSLAHVRLMLDFLEGHAQLPEALIQPQIACFRKSIHPELAARIEKLGLEVLEITGPEPDEVGTADIQKLREALHARKADAIVWVSYVAAMPFAFAMRLAPVQIWWAMKYHSLEFDEIDGYLASGSVSGGTRRIGAREWRIGPVAAEDWMVPELAAQAALERSRFAQHRVLYGCIGREEKLNSVPFLESVAAILKAVPDAGFMWTGRQRHPAIQAKLEAEGVADRCHFIGWVNTRLYAQVIDVFLDSYPFPCGYTLYEAMAAGKPAVLYASEESAETGARSLIEPMLQGADGAEEDQAQLREIFRSQSGDKLFLLAHQPAEYIDLAVHLAGDDEFRRLSGSAGRAFVERFMSDRRRAGRIYGEHIVSIVRDAAK